MPKKLHIPAGTRFGRLAVLEEAEPHISRRGAHIRRFRCQCDCGKVSVVRLHNLRSGHIASCGCLPKGRPRTNRVSRTPEYRAWYMILRRCLCHTNKDYKNYGGRGITVCDRWLKSVAAFLEDMGPRPSPTHSIDRIDCDGNYEPSNCRWATWTQQARNRRDNVILTHGGETKCIADWADDTGISRFTLNARIRNGWSVARTLTTPARTRSL